ncbi:uncharacterized protein ARMOST_12374 [Armillaria ostoyae]|uniref:Uncharacterized protein n=1 Tax=Armillaria ostoyae TaxID=47428 RepID=A0A284RJR8_ARMOS|nr:uncharacterized protein ARMOST_12374 [Armillaria ostoyae]
MLPTEMIPDHIKHESTPEKLSRYRTGASQLVLGERLTEREAFFDLGSMGSWDIRSGRNYAGSGTANRVLGDVGPAAIPFRHPERLANIKRYSILSLGSHSQFPTIHPTICFVLPCGGKWCICASNHSALPNRTVPFEIVVDELWTWRVHSGWMDRSSFWSLKNSQQKEMHCPYCSASWLERRPSGNGVVGAVLVMLSAGNGDGITTSLSPVKILSYPQVFPPDSLKRSRSNGIVVQPHPIHTCCENLS